ncbi:MAG: hypothetical protein ACLFUZ_01835 [Candidatus Micrarchaeia archaeon]
MRPITLFLSLLLVLGLLFPANLQDYMYEGENQTGSESFSAMGADYEIVYINGEEALILKNGELLDDESEIDAVLYQYYMEQYYPTQAEIDNLTELLNLYHDSRENGDMWEGVEEEECRMSIFLHAFPCTNDSIPETWEEAKHNDCFMTASVVCEEYGDYVGCSDPLNILPVIQDIAISSNRLTEIDNQTQQDLANLSESNMYDVLLEIDQNIELMREYEEKLETTKFRVPYSSGGDTCNDCYGICPPIIIEEEYLDQADERVEEMLPEVEYIEEYEELSEKLHNSTVARKEYKLLNEQRSEYTTEFAPQEERAEEVLAEADELLEYVSDDTVMSNSGRVREILIDIETDINNSDFASTESNLNELDAKLNVLETLISESWEVYNNTVEAKERADMLFFTLDTKDLPASQQAEFTALKAEKRTQDRSFVEGLSPEKYQQLTEKYTELGNSALITLDSVEASETVVNTFKGAGTKTNEGIADFTSTMAPLERTQKEQVSEYTPIVISSLSFFSLSSLAIFLFLFAFATLSHFFRNKVTLFAGILLLGCSILFAGVVSGGIYYVLSSSSSDASFTDFKDHVLFSEYVSIIVETEGAPAGASTQMMACAEELSTSLEGKDVVVYNKMNSECLINGQNVTLAECYNTVEEPIILFRYSTVDESPQFNTGFVYKGTFSGDEDYFGDCQVATAFTEEVQEYSYIPEEENEGNTTSQNETSQ